MEKNTKYEVQDVYCTVDEKRDLKDDEHYLYKAVYKVKKWECLPYQFYTKFVKVVDDNWLKHHKTYYNHDVIDNTEKTVEKFGYYSVVHKFRTDFLGKQFEDEKLAIEQVKNPSYEKKEGY